MPASLTPIQIACLLVVTIAAVTDLSRRKIPNWLTFPAAAAGLIMNGLVWGPWGLLWSIFGWWAGLAIMLISKSLPMLLKFYKKAPIAWGDTKLVAAVGAFLGPWQVLMVFFFFCLYFGGMSIIQIGRFIPFRQLLYGLALDRQKIDAARKSWIPIGVAIALATITTVFFGQHTLRFLGLA